MTAGYKNWTDTLINGIYRVKCQTWWYSSCKLRELFTNSVFSGAYKIYIYCPWGLSTLSWLQGIERRKTEKEPWKRWPTNLRVIMLSLLLLAAVVVVAIALGLPRHVAKKKRGKVMRRRRRQPQRFNGPSRPRWRRKENEGWRTRNAITN